MLANDTSFIERLPGDNAFDAQCRLREVDSHGTHFGDRRASRNFKHVHDSLRLETPVGCIDRPVGEVCSCRVPSISGPTADPELPILPEVDVLAGLLLDAFLSLKTDAKLSGPPS